MANVGGRVQAQFMARIRGLDPERCLVVPVDVGKSAAMSLIADHYGWKTKAWYRGDQKHFEVEGELNNFGQSVMVLEAH